MFSILILGTGLVAVASLFPVAGTIQRNTYDDVLAQQIGESATAMLRARGFSPLDFISLIPDETVRALPRTILDNISGNAVTEWEPIDRGYPSGHGGAHDKSFYWVPLIRTDLAHGAPGSLVFIFVLRREEGVHHNHAITNLLDPDVANPDDPPVMPAIRYVGVVPDGKNPSILHLASALEFDEGDVILDDLGVIHQVVEVIDSTTIRVSGLVTTGTGGVDKIWYATRGARSPTHLILAVPLPIL